MPQQIIIVKPSTLSKKDKAKLIKAGQVVVEHPSPAEIVYKSDMPQSDFYHYALCGSCGERIYMLNERLNRIKTSNIRFYCIHGHINWFKP